jgi:hypothetical protein
VQKTFGSTAAIAVLETLSASVGAQLSVPIYQGGSAWPRTFVSFGAFTSS